MAGQNLKQLLEKAKELMRKHKGQDYSLELIETLVQDHCWEAKSVENTSGIENPNIVSTLGYGQTPEDALNMLIEKLTAELYQETLWKDIMEKAECDEHGLVCTVNTYTLRKILERYKLLPETKEGM